jgi:cobalt-zinc-cadmium efflux system outer membrane protein
VRDHADHLVCDLAAHPLDVAPMPATDPGAPMPPAEAKKQGSPLPPADVSFSQRQASPADLDPQVRRVAAQVLPPPKSEQPGAEGSRLPRPPEPFVERFLRTVPPELRPRLEVRPPIPPVSPSPQEKAEYQRKVRELIRKEFPPLPALGPDPQPLPGPDGRAMTLADLQRLAMTNSPLLRQAAADVEAARGAAIQAGAYPNPNFGYQSDTAGTGATAGFQGIFFEQTIKTAGKLKLQQAAASMDVQNTQLAFRRAQTDLMAQVRGGYFAVLVARENVKISRFLVDLTTALYDVTLRSFEQGFATYYDVQQMRVLLLQAHGLWVQARNRHTSAWKQLAATLGLPAMPVTELEGQATLPVMRYDYDSALARVLNSHTDVLTAVNTVHKARYNLRLAQITPVPDVSLHLAVEKDYSVPPFAITHSIQLGVPVPIWDQNKGNIIQSQGALLRATEEAHRVRDDLTTRLADAFERYENNRILISYFVNWMLTDEVSAFLRALSSQGFDAPLDIRGLAANIVANDQLLVTVFTGYVTALAAQWQAVADVANLLQTDDLFDVMDPSCVQPMPDLYHLPPVPCCHPCTPLPDPQLKGADGAWPPPVPGLPSRSMPSAEKESTTHAMASPAEAVLELDTISPIGQLPEPSK